MATVNGTITITIDEPSASTPTVSTQAFTYDDEEDMTGVCDIEYLASTSSGGPVMRPSKPRF
jgi:hypothetical protein